MGTFDVVDKISSLPILDYKGVVDFTDKMSFIASCIILIACSLIITLREYVMDPISCYMSHSPGGENLLKFIENYCWVQGTMTIHDHKVPDNAQDWKEFERSRIVYYQWAPFMLLFQAALFHIPKILWTVICFNMTGIDVQNLVKMTDSEEPEKVASMMENLLVQHREYRKGVLHNVKLRLYKTLKCCIISKRLGNWLACGYIIMKILYFTNSIGQIFLMQTFLQLNSHEEYSSNFGMEIARNIISGRNWEVTNIFPRVTYCLARVKHMANINTVTAQCVLTANLFIEKIYIFLWFWIVIVAIFTGCSLLIWAIRLFWTSRGSQEIDKLLRLQGHDLEKPDLTEKFCKRFLRLDGIFIIHMMNLNAGDLATGAVVSKLYSTYLEKYKDANLFKDDQFYFGNKNDTYKLTSRNSDSSPMIPI